MIPSKKEGLFRLQKNKNIYFIYFYIMNRWLDKTENAFGGFNEV